MTIRGITWQKRITWSRSMDGLCTQIWKRGERRFKLKKKTCLKGWTAAVGNLIWKKNCNSSNSLFCSSWTWLYFFFSEVKDQFWVKCNIGLGGSSFAPTIQESLVWVFKAFLLQAKYSLEDLGLLRGDGTVGKSRILDTKIDQSSL